MTRATIALLASLCAFASGCGKSEDGSCTEGKAECVGKTQIRLCKGGEWFAPQNCPTGQTCMTMSGIQHCMATAPTRDGGNTARDSGGPARSGDGGDCTRNQQRCVGEQAMSCINGAWGPPKDCPAGQTCMTLNGGVQHCVSTGDGGALRFDIGIVCRNGIEQCVGTKKVKTCKNGKWSTAVECPKGETCMTMPGGLQHCMKKMKM